MRLPASPVVVFLLLLGLVPASKGASGPSSCAARIHSFKNSAPLSSLPKEQQKKILRALDDDIAELSEIDLASTERSKSAYRQYVSDRLQFQAVKSPALQGQLLLISYQSNTMCGENNNCPVWIVRLGPAGATSMVPWQKELGTSAGGGWGFVSRAQTGTSFPEIILLTHFSSAQTGLSCYSESKRQYLRVPCSAECLRWLQYADEW
jgi:hypothetical protein